jgi:hypothetical protein
MSYLAWLGSYKETSSWYIRLGVVALAIGSFEL